eukprot:c9151_g1_i1 orf=454-711(-)
MYHKASIVLSPNTKLSLWLDQRCQAVHTLILGFKVRYKADHCSKGGHQEPGGRHIGLPRSVVVDAKGNTVTLPNVQELGFLLFVI